MAGIKESAAFKREDLLQMFNLESNNIQDIDKYFEVHILVENNRI